MGILIHGPTDPRVITLVEALGAVGQLWVATLRMTVLPLMIGLTLVAITGGGGAIRSARSASGRFSSSSSCSWRQQLITLAFATPISSLYPGDAGTTASFRAGTSVPSPSVESTRRDSTSLGEWRIALIPSNVFQAAVSGDILPILLSRFSSRWP